MQLLECSKRFFECCYAVAGVLWKVCVPIPAEAAVCLHFYEQIEQNLKNPPRKLSHSLARLSPVSPEQRYQWLGNRRLRVSRPN